jgi:phosphoribosylamine-glycine ligase
MKIFVGSGGRRTCIAMRSPGILRLKDYAAPGNGGTAGVANKCFNAGDNINGLLEFARNERID